MGRKSIEKPYDPNQRFVDARGEDLSATSFALPNAVHTKLSQLALRSEEGGMPVSKADMVGTLIAFADFDKLDPTDLAQLVLKYRKSTPVDIGMTGEKS